MDITKLPWINIVDKDAIYIAKDYLPNNPVIIEAGVCDAEDTLRFKDLWPQSKIYGFEPVPSLYAKSKKNTLNLSDVYIYQNALSSEVGTKSFFSSTAMPGASSFLKDNLNKVTAPIEVAAEFENGDKTYRDDTISVDCYTIDSFCTINSIPVIDYIWLDVEGYEIEVLKGAKKILPTVKVCSLELNFQEFRKGMPLFEEVYAFMENAGFNLKHIWQRYSNWQANGIFVKV